MDDSLRKAASLNGRGWTQGESRWCASETEVGEKLDVNAQGSECRENDLRSRDRGRKQRTEEQSQAKRW